jgi:hypothetical protein
MPATSNAAMMAEVVMPLVSRTAAFVGESTRAHS